MKHEHLSDEKISSFLDGEVISPQEIKHLEECKFCASKLKSYRVISKSLSELGVLSLSQDVSERIRNKIAIEALHLETPEPMRSISLKHIYGLGIVGAVILLVFIIYFTGFIWKNPNYNWDLQTFQNGIAEQSSIPSEIRVSDTINSVFYEEEDSGSLFLILASLSEGYEYRSDKDIGLIETGDLSNVSLSDVVLALCDGTNFLEEY